VGCGLVRRHAFAFHPARREEPVDLGTPAQEATRPRFHHPAIACDRARLPAHPRFALKHQHLDSAVDPTGRLAHGPCGREAADAAADHHHSPHAHTVRLKTGRSAAACLSR